MQIEQFPKFMNLKSYPRGLKLLYALIGYGALKQETLQKSGREVSHIKVPLFRKSA